MFKRYSVTKVGNYFLKNRTFNALYRLQWTRPRGHGSGVKIGLFFIQKMAKSLKLRIKKEKELFYPSSESIKLTWAFVYTM